MGSRGIEGPAASRRSHRAPTSGWRSASPWAAEQCVPGEDRRESRRAACFDHSTKSGNRPKNQIYCAPWHARMAELVDAPDSKSGSLKRVWVRFPLRAPEFYLWTSFEFLQQLRLVRRIQDSRRGPFAAPRMLELRHGPLQESFAGSRLRTRVARQDFAVPPRHRTSAGILDGAGRFHGERRNPTGRGGARMLRGGTGEGGYRLAAGRGQRDGCQPGARDVPGQIAAA